jgi:hypothetical protein
MAQHVYIDLGKFLLFSRKYSWLAFNKMKPSAVKIQYLKGPALEVIYYPHITKALSRSL